MPQCNIDLYIENLGMEIVMAVKIFLIAIFSHLPSIFFPDFLLAQTCNTRSGHMEAIFTYSNLSIENLAYRGYPYLNQSKI